MNCEQGEHRFKPFKRSQALYCKSCGLVISESIQRQRLVQEAQRAIPPGKSAISPESSQAANQDPYYDQARNILEKATFERVIERILNEQGAFGPLREKLKFEAMQFGPTLDLDMWAARVAEHIEKMEVETPMEDLIEEFGGQ